MTAAAPSAPATESGFEAAREPAAREAGTETMELDLERLKKRHIERILAREGGSVAAAARRLGIRRGTLYRQMEKFGIERPGSKADPAGV